VAIFIFLGLQIGFRIEGAEGEALRGIARRARAGIMAGGEVARGGGRQGRRGRDGEGDQIAVAKGAEGAESLDEEGGGAMGAGGDGEDEGEEEDDQVSLAGFVGFVCGFVRRVCWEVLRHSFRVSRNRRRRGSVFCSESTSEDPPPPGSRPSQDGLDVEMEVECGRERKRCRQV
jgi:hypothetical protein